MLQRVSPTHMDTGLSKLNRKERGTVEVTETQARASAVREALECFPCSLCTSPLSLLPPLSTLLQPHRPLWWSSNLPRTVLPPGFRTCPSPGWNTLLCILVSCLVLSPYLLKCHIPRKASDYPISNGVPLSSLFPNPTLFFSTMG